MGLERWAAIRPDAVAVRVDGGGTLTFGHWDRTATRWARALAAAGHGPGTRIGLHFDNASYVDFAVAYVAVRRAAAVAVPLSRALPAGALDEMVRGAGVEVLLDPAAVRELDAAGQAGARLPVAGPGDLAEILFTSGSTGAPKAVAVTGANLEGAAQLERTVARRPGAQLHAIPVGTNWGQVALRATLAAGVASLVMPAFDALRMLDLIEQHRPAEVLLVPAMARLLLAVASDRRRRLDSVRTVRLSAAPVAPATLEGVRRAFPAAVVHVGYSSTEASPACTMMTFPGDPPDTVGRAPEGHQVQVVGAAGEALPPGALGEVRLRCPGVPARSYLGTSGDGTFEDGWVRTGDLGRLDAGGCLRLSGRGTEVIDVGGHTVHAPEVEAALIEHPGVVDAAVFGVPSRVLGEQVAAAVVLAAPLDVRELVRDARTRLARHKVPSAVHVVAELPRTPAGKVAKAELRRRIAARGELAGEADLEHQLCRLWGEALGVADVGPDDDLASLGADSLTTFAVLARLEERSGTVVPPSRFMMLQTVRDQARMVSAVLAS